MKKPLISLQNISISLRSGKMILSNQDLDLNAGNVVMLIGPSGSGKSTLAMLLAGLISNDSTYAVQGSLQAQDKQVDLAKSSFTIAGYVFQDGALFADLTAADNLAFAWDHVCTKTDLRPQKLPRDLLPRGSLDRPINTLSGGESMRVAIARTLSSGHTGIIYDEPNSGLDPDVSARLTQFIADYAHESGRPALVIAHHYKDLVHFADRIFFMSPAKAKLIDVTEAARQGELIGIYAAEQPSSLEKPPLVTQANEGDTLKEPTASSQSNPIKWIIHYFKHYLWMLLASPSALIYLILGMLMLGVVSTWFLFQHFPYKEFLAPLFRDNTLQALGFVLYREVVPIAACVLVAARASAMLCNDLGYRKYSNHFAAMHNLGISVTNYFVVIPLLTMFLTSILSSFLGFLITSFACWQTWHLLFPEESLLTWRNFYFQQILTGEGIFWVLLKIGLSGLGIGAITCWFGFKPKRNVLDVHAHTARAIIGSILVTLLLQTVIALMEF